MKLTDISTFVPLFLRNIIGRKDAAAAAVHTFEVNSKNFLVVQTLIVDFVKYIVGHRRSSFNNLFCYVMKNCLLSDWVIEYNAE